MSKTLRKVSPIPDPGQEVRTHDLRPEALADHRFLIYFYRSRLSGDAGPSQVCRNPVQ